MKKTISMLLSIVYIISLFTPINVFAQQIEEKQNTYFIGENGYLYYNDGQTDKIILQKNVVEFDIDNENSKITVLVEENNTNNRYESSLDNIGTFELVDERTVATDNFEDEIMLFGTSENQAEIYDFLINTMKLNQAAASGVIANLKCENGTFEPNRRQGGGTGYGSYNDAVGYGLCQWTYWSRKKNLKDWCNKNTGNGSWSTLYGQLMFMKHELEKSYTTALKKNKSCS